MQIMSQRLLKASTPLVASIAILIVSVYLQHVLFIYILIRLMFFRPGKNRALRYATLALPLSICLVVVAKMADAEKFTSLAFWALAVATIGIGLVIITYDVVNVVRACRDR